MKRILLVDDHAVVRRGLRQIITEELGETHCGEVETARDALAAVRREPWDVVVLDLTLPDSSGLEVLGQIRASHPDLPVLILSMHPEEQYGVPLLKAGAAGYLAKESAPAELGIALRKVLAGGRYVSARLAERLAVRLAGEDDRPLHEQLSLRELEVLVRIASGKSVGDIGRELSLSVKTVSTYRTRILLKMGLRHNAELTSYALRHGLVQ